MSYSFSVKAATKDEAKKAVADYFAGVVAQQPVHARDQAAVLANANAVIDLLADDDTKGVSVSGSGHVSWSSGDAVDAKFHAVSISCSACHVARAVDPV